MNIDQDLVNDVFALCQLAANKILSVYQRPDSFGIQTKADSSPVTEADLASNQCLLEGLSALTPDIPILTEESELPAFAVRKHWARYWLIDPLDGTKEFIHRNGEFTINVALIDRGHPVLGLVHTPVTGVAYAGLLSGGAFKIERGHRAEIYARPVSERVKQSLPVKALVSRHHGAAQVDDLCQRVGMHFGAVNKVPVGSSLKFCLIAEGSADIYPRFGPTSEWDTAAAQAIVEAAGGCVVDSQLRALRYNQKESILNPNFYALGQGLDDWRSVLLSDG